MGLLGSYNPKQQLDGAVALCKLANKAMTLSPVDAAPPSPTPQVGLYEAWLVLILHSIIAKSLIVFPPIFLYDHYACILMFSRLSFFSGPFHDNMKICFLFLFILIRSLCAHPHA